MYVFFGSCLGTALYTGFFLYLRWTGTTGRKNSNGRGYYRNVNYPLHLNKVSKN